MNGYRVREKFPEQSYGHIGFLGNRNKFPVLLVKLVIKAAKRREILYFGHAELNLAEASSGK